ncbi:MAG: hypothetical protein Q9203_004802 [Teloschistes exilis]
MAASQRDGRNGCDIHHRTNFPVSTATTSGHHRSRQYSRVSVPLHASRVKEKQQSQSTRFTTSVLLQTWAVLLHKFTGSETVSFAVFHNPGSSELSFPTTTYSREEGNSAHTLDASVVRYSVLEDAALNDVKQVSTETWVTGDQRVRGTFNTAVVFTSGIQSTTKKRRMLESDNTSLDSEDQTERLQLDVVFHAILEQIIWNPNGLVRQLDIIQVDQKLQIQRWNVRDPFAAQINECLHGLVAAQCQRTPGAEAVCSWDGSLTYHELHQLATVAAKRLQDAGVGPSCYVPFAYEKSLWAVVAMLSILMAGAAFVPLNPHDPRARLDQILKSTSAGVVITSEKFAAHFERLVDRVVIITEETVKLSDLEDPLCHSATSKTAPEDPVFVLFTSGSTGVPKGMVHTHRSICSHALSHGKEMDYQDARVLQFAAYTFDVAIIDTFTTLVFGGCICIPSEEDRKTNIVGAIGSMRANHAILTPSFAGVIEPSDVPTLRILAVGGEALPQERVQRWAEKVRLIQIYGPAEVGICLTITMHASTRPETVGRPLENSSCWLVDPDCADLLVPIGAVGELVVAGPCLALGYLNDVKRTEASFIVAPRWARQLGFDESTRFHKTGDLLRYNLDAFNGTLDFVGRKDAQIKLRGQRIEPGEIEYHLGKIPGVAVCMVTKPASGCFTGELIAVIQRNNEAAPSKGVREASLSLMVDESLGISNVRQEMGRVLPVYMIPSVCLTVECMPLVPSLKIDRRTVDRWLQDMTARPLGSALTVFTALDTNEDTASRLSLAVAQLVAAKDPTRCMMLQGNDFRLHEIGIDSIQIISLSMLLQREYAIRLPVGILMSSGLTIRKLASLIDRKPDSLSFSQEISNQIDIHQEASNFSQSLLHSISSQGHRNFVSRIYDRIRNILVTGGTGYLGTAILHQLLSGTEIDVYVLIQHMDSRSGLQRIREAGTLHAWWQESYTSRLHIWYGDLALPNLGLGESELQRLQGDGVSSEHAIHALIHNGARVHYCTDYDGLKAVNVHGTATALQLAASSPYMQRFVFVSGGTAPSFDISRPAAPADSPIPSPQSSSSSPSSSSTQLHPSSSSTVSSNPTSHSHPPSATLNGYALSKLVAETLIKQCTCSPFFPSKLKVQIIKPGYIIGAPPAGLANRTDFLWRLVESCIRIQGYDSEDAKLWLSVADTETIARAVLEDIIAPIPMGQEKGAGDDDESTTTTNTTTAPKNPTHQMKRLTNGLPLFRLWTILSSQYNYPLRPLASTEFHSQLHKDVLSLGNEHKLFPLMEMVEKGDVGVGEDVTEMGEGVEAVEEAVRRNIAYLVKMGFLPPAGDSIGFGG